MKKLLKLMAIMLATATFAQFIISCNEDENTDTSVIEVNSVKVDATSLNLEVGAKRVLTATILPADAAQKSIDWASYNTDIAIVSPTGALTAEITAVAIGTTIITISAANDKRALCEVTVAKSVPVTAITVRPEGPLHLEQGESIEFSAVQGPANATNYSPVWTSSNPDIITVDNGFVTAVGLGTATVTVTSGEASKSVEIMVSGTMSEITLTPNGPLHFEEIGDTQTLTATPVPENAKYYSPVWVSGNSSVVTVSETGLVTAVGLGATNVAIISGEFSNSVEVTVTSAYLHNFTITPNTETPMSLGETLQIETEVIPADARNYSLNWRSSNTSVATVSETGLVTAISKGITTITASANSMSGATIEKSVTISVGMVKLSKTGWTAESKDNATHSWGEYGGEAYRAIDGDINTGWHSATWVSLPQCLVVDMKESNNLTRVGVSHFPGEEWMIYYQTIEIYLSNNPVTAGERQEYWGDPVAVYEYYGGNPIDIDLAANSQGQYIILYFPNSASDPYMSLAELDVYGSK